MAFIAEEHNIGGGSTATVLVPATASAGDLLIVTITLQADEVTSATTGLTLVTESSVGTQSSGRVEVYEGTVTSGGALDPGDTITLGLTSNAPWALSCEAYDPAEVLDFAVNYTAALPASTVTSPGATAMQPCIAHHIYGVLTSTAVTGDPLTWTAHASTTKRVDICCTAAAGGGTRQGLHMTADETISGAGAVAARLATPSANVQGQSITLLLGTAVDQPTADAGDDQSVAVGATVNLDGTASGGSGAPYTYAWTQTSGTTVTLNDDEAENPSFTAPATSAVLVFELVVTDDDGIPSPADSVTITVSGPEDVALPVSNHTVAGWTTDPSGAVFEVLGDNLDSTFAESSEDPSSLTLRTSMSALNTPSASDTVVVSARVRRQNASSATVTLQLVEGASTVVASDDFNIPSGDDFQGISLTLTPGEIESVTGSAWEGDGETSDLDVAVIVTAVPA